MRERTRGCVCACVSACELCTHVAAGCWTLLPAVFCACTPLSNGCSSSYLLGTETTALTNTCLLLCHAALYTSCSLCVLLVLPSQMPRIMAERRAAEEAARKAAGGGSSSSGGSGSSSSGDSSSSSSGSSSSSSSSSGSDSDSETSSEDSRDKRRSRRR